MKKFLSILLSLAVLLSSVATLNLTVYADVITGNCGKNGDNVTYSFDTSTGVLTISGEGEMADYEFGGAERSPFSCSSQIKSIVINSGVTSIGCGVFFDCESLEKVTIPNSVTSIGNYAFGKCISLTSVTIPNSVTSIGYLAFEYCYFIADNFINNSAIKHTGETIVDSDVNGFCIKDNVLVEMRPSYAIGEVTIPDSVTSIDSYAFSFCTNLTSVTIPNSVTSIDGRAFYGCTNLTNINVEENNPNYSSKDGVLYNKYINALIQYPVANERTSYNIPNGVIYILSEAFEGCTSLTSVTIPSSVTYIGGSAFEDCTSLTSVTIPNSVTSIGDDAFFYCTSLTNVTIPNSVTSIGDSAFSGCYFTSDNFVNNSSCKDTGETIVDSDVDGFCIKDNVLVKVRSRYAFGEVTIPNSVTSIGEYAFYDCTSLTSVTIPNSVTSIGDCAFYVCTSLTSVTIPNSVTSIGDSAFFYCTSLTSVTIPNSVTSIGDSAFFYCTSLTSVTIPNSVTSIGEGAFYGCTSLTSITVEESNPNYLSEGGILFNKDKTELIQYPIGNKRKSYNIPNGVTRIRRYNAFCHCENLMSITIPNSMTSIGYGAFYDCTSLTSVTMPNSVTSIGDHAFNGCTSLTSVTISNSVTSIGYDAFYKCRNLKDVYYTGTKEDWNMIDIYFRNDCLTNATIHYNSIIDDPTQPPTPAPTEPVIPPSSQEPEVPNAPTVTEPTTVTQPTTGPSTIVNSEPTTVPATEPTTSTTVVTKSVAKPKSTKIKKATGSNKAVAITWAKVSGVKGYQIQLATDKKFKKNKKTVIIKKQKTTKTTVKKLKAKKKYYVRVRTYKTVNGKKVYSSWSKTKTVKTK